MIYACDAGRKPFVESREPIMIVLHFISITSRGSSPVKPIQDTYGTEAEYLWADSPGNAIFRHPASKKWYAAMMRVLPKKLGFTGEEPLDVMLLILLPLRLGCLADSILAAVRALLRLPGAAKKKMAVIKSNIVGILNDGGIVVENGPAGTAAAGQAAENEGGQHDDEQHREHEQNSDRRRGPDCPGLRRDRRRQL